MPIEHRALHLGPLDNNTYLLTCARTRETAVVDVGFEPDAVIAALAKANLTPRWLLATHAHYDHVAGMRAVQEAAGGVFRLHPADRPLLANLGAQGAAFGFPAAAPPEQVVDLVPGEPVPLGDESLDVLWTPGHSPGSVSFVWKDHAWVGDVLFAGSIGRTDLPGGSFEELERSIRTQLFPLGDAVNAYCGHGPPTTLGRERRENPFVGERARSM
jgi:glyoxylase-like metal-dependent hydrolase (beta-lactamase superfamily II)